MIEVNGVMTPKELSEMALKAARRDEGKRISGLIESFLVERGQINIFSFMALLKRDIEEVP